MTMIPGPPGGRNESRYVTIPIHNVLLLCRDVLVLDTLNHQAERTYVTIRRMRVRSHSVDSIDQRRRPVRSLLHCFCDLAVAGCHVSFEGRLESFRSPDAPSPIDRVHEDCRETVGDIFPEISDTRFDKSAILQSTKDPNSRPYRVVEQDAGQNCLRADKRLLEVDEFVDPAVTKEDVPRIPVELYQELPRQALSEQLNCEGWL